MCQNKCPNCNNKISFISVLTNAMFSVTQEPIKCENCNKKVKPIFSKSIGLAMIPQLFIIPVMNIFALTVLEITVYAFAHIFVSTAILVCLTSFSIEPNKISDITDNKENS